MGKKLRQIGELYGIKNIEEMRKEYGDKINLTYYPTINNFTSVSHYESYAEDLILKLRQELSNSKDELAKLKITFKLDKGGKFFEMPFIQFVYNVLLWRPFIEFNVPVTKNDLFTSEIFHNNKYSDFINEFVENNRDKFTMADISECLMKIQHDFNQMAVKVGPIFGLSLSIYDMVKMAKRNKEVASIINADVSLEGRNVSEIEDFLKSQSERLMNILANEDDKNNPLKPFIRSKTGINSYQLRSNFINIGFKPSASSGKTIPIVSTSSLIDKGIATPQDLFVDASGGRLAALYNRKVDQFGYLSRHLTLSSSDISLHPDPNYSCDTVTLYVTTIKSQRELEALDGRFMKVGEKKYKIIREKDKHLIGKTVELRTPTTCASKDGICKVCYGALYNVNININAGLYAAVTLSEASTQTGLSAKHVLETKSEELNIIDHKSILYNHNGWLFSLNEHTDLEKYEVVFGATDVIAENEDKYDKYDNYYVDKLSFINKLTTEVFEVHEEGNSQLYLSKQLFDVLLRHKYFNLEDKQVISIPLTEFNTKDPFVFLRVENEGLTKHINELKNFIQKGDKPLEGVESYNDLIEKLNMLFRMAKMNYPSVHIEMVARPLIRDANDPLKLPDWSKERAPHEYKLISLHKSAITKNSVTAGLIFERIKKQLASPLTYKKTGSSVNSLFFINE